MLIPLVVAVVVVVFVYVGWLLFRDLRQAGPARPSVDWEELKSRYRSLTLLRRLVQQWSQDGRISSTTLEEVETQCQRELKALKGFVDPQDIKEMGQ